MMEKVKSSESNRDSRSYDLRRIFSVVFAGILFLGVFVPEKALGVDKMESDEGIVWITGFQHRFSGS